MEKKVSFSVSGTKLIGILHIPKEKNPPGIVMVHGFRVDKGENFGHFEIAAKRFCDEGFLVLRFDCRGSGESEGRQEDMTIPSEVEDTLAAVNFVKTHGVDKKRVVILGKSLGGEVAILASLKAKPKLLILWAPVTASRRYNKRLTPEEKEELKTKGWLLTKSPSSGKMFKVGQKFYETESKIKIEDKIKKLECPTLIIHGDADKSVPLEQSKTAYKTMTCKKSLKIIKGMNHSFEGNMDEVIDASLEWLKTHG